MNEHTAGNDDGYRNTIAWLAAAAYTAPALALAVAVNWIAGPAYLVPALLIYMLGALVHLSVRASLAMLGEIMAARREVRDKDRTQ